MENSVKLNRVTPSDVSISQIFKSSFARSFVSTYHDNKILDMDNLNDSFNISSSSVDHFLDNFQNKRSGDNSNTDISNNIEAEELNNLRKQCQMLSEENKRLQNALAHQETSQFDSAFLQSQVDTLKWQLKQTESSRQMYRSLMKQVISFLERAHKSLDLLHASNSSSQRSKSSSRNSRSQTIYPDDSLMIPSRRSTSPTSSKFTRTKSVTQISAAHAAGHRDFTWSVLRRNDPSHSPSPSSSSSRTLNKTPEHRPTQLSFNISDGSILKSANSDSVEKIESDHIPPEKLSQEAFRLLRTAESLLAMREPDLSFSSSSSRISSSSSTSAVTADDENTSASVIIEFGSTQTPDGSKSTNSNNLDDLSRIEDCSAINDRDPDNRLSSFHKTGNLEMSASSPNTLQPFFSHNNFDSASLNSSSSKAEEEERHSISFNVNSNSNNNSINEHCGRTISEVKQCTSTPNSTISRKTNRYKTIIAETKDQRDLGLKEKPTSVSSAEDESGFSSMNSFHDVGLPQPTITPVKQTGCHTEIGLPDVPLDRINHRRWSSTPAEIQAMFRRYKNTYLSNPSSTTETLSVWV
ncbi:homeobox protein 9-like [Microplitis mediator]|uniref:homeobox protein 9-like n=1 Tax=Microplitis mediator TaxID=375433 RepID=UPI002556E89C|nr:homeobox protein 9-like [Microplitis mediator]